MSALPAQPEVPRAGEPQTLTGRWSVVAGQSRVGFHVRDKLVTTVHGSMPVEGGIVVVDAAGQVTEAWVALSVAGIATGNAHRDRDLRKPRFLDEPSHPSVRVVVQAASSTTTGWTARASVLARGTRAPVELAAEPLARTDEQIRIRVTGRLDRSPLGIKAPTVVVGRFLDLDADLTLRREPAARPSW